MQKVWIWILGIIVLFGVIGYSGRHTIQSILPGFGTSGTLVFAVTDPGQPNLPPQAEGKGNKITSGKVQGNGPQTVTALNLTITKVEVHFATDQNTTSPAVSITPTISPTEPTDHWETLTLTTPFTVDLVKLASSNNIATLGITTLAAGKYTQVRLFLSSASAKLANGTTVSLDILGQDNIVKVIQPFTVVAGQKTTLVMDFDAQHSVIKADSKYILKPVVAKLLEQR